jgi:hypothetical protein
MYLLQLDGPQGGGLKKLLELNGLRSLLDEMQSGAVLVRGLLY